MSADSEVEQLSIAGHRVDITHPGKPYFSKQVRLTKLDVVRYYLSVAEGALLGIRDRPLVLKRFVNGAEAPPFYQKRAPEKRPAWLASTTLSFPSGRTAEELVVNDAAALAWIVNLGCIELHPHAVRRSDLEHPDELRIDLDPGPGVSWQDVRRVALEVRDVLGEHELVGYPKTSGSRGMHVNVRIEPRWSFTRSASRRARARARGGAPFARSGELEVVEGGTPRRVPRLQPKRQGPHYRVRVLGAAYGRRARVYAARVVRSPRL